MKLLANKQRKENDAKTKALWVALQHNLNPNAQSLAASYGLPVADVERIIRSRVNG